MQALPDHLLHHIIEFIPLRETRTIDEILWKEKQILDQLHLMDDDTSVHRYSTDDDIEGRRHSLAHTIVQLSRVCKELHYAINGSRLSSNAWTRQCDNTRNSNTVWRHVYIWTFPRSMPYTRDYYDWKVRLANRFNKRFMEHKKRLVVYEKEKRDLQTQHERLKREIQRLTMEIEGVNRGIEFYDKKIELFKTTNISRSFNWISKRSKFKIQERSKRRKCRKQRSVQMPGVL